MNVKEHYDSHLGDFYSWMIGDFAIKQKEQQDYFVNQNIVVLNTSVALDLGAGHGLQSVSLANIGFKVIAIDFNEQLVRELKRNSLNLDVTAFKDDIRSVKNYSIYKPELIVCAGDTLTHLAGKLEIAQFIKDCAETLENNGKLFLSFRDYSQPLSGNRWSIPVKSDENKTLICSLDYFDDNVLVTDTLHEKTEAGWQQRISTYSKTRIDISLVIALLKVNGFTILVNEPVNRMTTIIAQKHVKPAAAGPAQKFQPLIS